MKRLLAAVGLAGVICLTLILAACTDGISSQEENPLSDRSNKVSGTVFRGDGSPQGSASVFIYYFYTSILYPACDSAVLTALNGTYSITYVNAARRHQGIAKAWIDIEGTMYSGWSDLFYYPIDGGDVTGIDITLTEE
ncbi:MAG TPA: hypothetical protein VM054_08140 [bacterium]|nr:hypothetical protein [bacterium]